MDEVSLRDLLPVFTLRSTRMTVEMLTRMLSTRERLHMEMERSTLLPSLILTSRSRPSQDILILVLLLSLSSDFLHFMCIYQFKSTCITVSCVVVLDCIPTFLCFTSSISCTYSTGSVSSTLYDLSLSLFTICTLFRTIYLCVPLMRTSILCQIRHVTTCYCASKDCSWMAQPPPSQLSQGQGHEMVFNPLICNSTSIPLQDTLDSQDNGAYNYSSVLKPLFAATMSTSDSMGSIFSNSQSAPLHGSQRVCIFHTFYNLKYN